MVLTQLQLELRETYHNIRTYKEGLVFDECWVCACVKNAQTSKLRFNFLHFLSLTEISFMEGGETGASGSKTIIVNDEVLIGNSKRGFELILIYDK